VHLLPNYFYRSVPKVYISSGSSSMGRRRRRVREDREVGGCSNSESVTASLLGLS
jgi:hypothetical protein